jgi:hypothetical protein
MRMRIALFAVAAAPVLLLRNGLSSGILECRALPLNSPISPQQRLERRMESRICPVSGTTDATPTSRRVEHEELILIPRRRKSRNPRSSGRRRRRNPQRDLF